MANQFNAWEPTLSGLEGNFQAEPRVFAHDAKPIVIGAINSTHSDGGFTFVGGTGFVAADVGKEMTAATGGATFKIVSIVGGVIVGLTMLTPGASYALGTAIALSGTVSGTGATFTVTNINIPNTQQRGCCLYIGAAGNISVIMEGGTEAITFSSLAAGTFLPILVTRITAGTSLIALY